MKDRCKDCGKENPGIEDFIGIDGFCFKCKRAQLKAQQEVGNWKEVHRKRIPL